MKLIVLTLVMTSAYPASAMELNGSASISDGDTVKVAGQRIRLAGRIGNASRRDIRFIIRVDGKLDV